jgi:hypothetical protein
MHYGTLEYVDPVPYPRTNRKICTRKTRSKPRSQKNVPANNCHPKVLKNMKIAWVIYLGALSHLSATLTPGISAHPPV